MISSPRRNNYTRGPGKFSKIYNFHSAENEPTPYLWLGSKSILDSDTNLNISILILILK